MDEHGQLKAIGEEAAYEHAWLRKAVCLPRAVTGSLFWAIFLGWPLPMYGSYNIFSRELITCWMIVLIF